MRFLDSRARACARACYISGVLAAAACAPAPPPPVYIPPQPPQPAIGVAPPPVPLPAPFAAPTAMPRSVAFKPRPLKCKVRTVETAGHLRKVRICK